MIILIILSFCYCVVAILIVILYVSGHKLIFSFLLHIDVAITEFQAMSSNVGNIWPVYKAFL